MIRPENLQNNMIPNAPQDRPFDKHEPSERAPVPTAEELEEAENPDTSGEPGEHAEKQHAPIDDDEVS